MILNSQAHGSGLVAAVVVTYNRLPLLRKCLAALAAQVAPAAQIFVIDNASTDGTHAWLEHWLPQNLPNAAILSLLGNTGGAGGFASGLRVAIEGGAQWIWMMDDDAEPQPEALRVLLDAAGDPANIYGSLAVSGENTAWATTLIDEGRIVHLAHEVPSRARVESIPLLGFLIHRSLVERIGYPDACFFIAADDIEYCLRARRAGAEIIVVGNSRIEHPRTQQKIISCFGARVAYLSLAPWKRYYDTRNRLLIARKYYGVRLLTEAIPGSCVRLYAALRYEPYKLAQLWAWCCGMFDGLLGIKGKRHQKWGIRQ